MQPVFEKITILIIGINKQLQILASVLTTLSLRASAHTGVAIRFPPVLTDFTEALRNLQRLRCGLPRRFAPRNDSAGSNPVI